MWLPPYSELPLSRRTCCGQFSRPMSLLSFLEGGKIKDVAGVLATERRAVQVLPPPSPQPTYYCVWPYSWSAPTLFDAAMSPHRDTSSSAWTKPGQGCQQGAQHTSAHHTAATSTQQQPNPMWMWSAESHQEEGCQSWQLAHPATSTAIPATHHTHVRHPWGMGRSTRTMDIRGGGNMLRSLQGVQEWAGRRLGGPLDFFWGGGGSILLHSGIRQPSGS